MSYDPLTLVQELAAKKDALMAARADAGLALENAQTTTSALAQAEADYANTLLKVEDAGRAPLVTGDGVVVLEPVALPLEPAPTPAEVVAEGLTEVTLDVAVVALEAGEVAIVAPEAGEAVLVVPVEPVVHEHRCGKCGGKKH